MKEYDIVIIGSGPGGYVAAIRAAQLKMRVLIVEKEALGGICLNWGCIPTKALLKSSETLYHLKKAHFSGIIAKDISFDLQKIVQQSRDASTQLNRGVGTLLKKNNVEVIFGHATIKTKHELHILGNDNKEYNVKAKNIIIATGASVRQLPNVPIDGKIVWSYKEAMTPKTLPQSLLVIGSGAIGMEFANFYSVLGTKVTIAEKMPRIMQTEDHDISALMHKAMEELGICIKTSATIDKFEVKNEKACVTITTNKKSEEAFFDNVISAAGVVPNTKGIGLENLGILLSDNGKIIVNNKMCTNVDNVYAIGDINDKPYMLAHKASHEGIICVEAICNINSHDLDYNAIPACIYTTPQVASIGYTEEAAKQLNCKIAVSKFPFIGNGKAVATHTTNGLVKIITNVDTGEVLGAHMIGENVSEMICCFGVLKASEGTVNEILSTIFPHPTISETIHEAALGVYNRTIHL
ncbi:Dihydrolipoyl dehydrogenase [Candidatus Fokinia solitaria]|uniref:Dihydrolipoyl dehydrogenase n=1 Tax=Candidatus Fokinia solitaria TaxID=1802984 RepID=A0A2U8BST3_9RICK|nr:dihydrolipoyl dehydrogenase [Candidatus Fokinia solitaria]AWD33414.1 Dihydrolipoyl dehydrogenase [Candidatus Fokinia solitaria]